MWAEVEVGQQGSLTLRVALRLRLRMWRFSVGGFEVESVSVWDLYSSCVLII